MIANAINWINVGLAAGIAAAALSVASQVTRSTRCAVRLGVFGIFGGAGLALAGGIWEFGLWAQTVLLGGVLIYMLANARSPITIPSALWSNRAAWAIVGVVLAVMAATFATSAAAADHKPAGVANEDCQLVARVVYTYAQRRDKGAPLENQLADMLERQKQIRSSAEVIGLFARELELLYRERRPPNDAALVAYRRCSGQALAPRRAM